MTREQQLRDMMRTIVGYEARRDSRGRLAVYELPQGDGGGKMEVAGINDRYHPVELAVLIRMLHAGKYDEAETYVQDFYARFTAVVLTWFSGPPDPGLEFFLRDCTFNRGPTGAAHVLQLALKVRDDGVVGSVTRGALAVAKPEELLLLLRRARQQYEYRFRDERSKFWQGLVNRWNKALADAQKFHAQGVQT